MAEIEKKGHDERHPVGEEAPKTDWQQAVEYVAENPKTVALAVGFLVVCIAAGGLYSLQSHARDRKVMTAYAAALNEEDAGARASALKEVAGRKSRWSGEALYLAGEASIEAKAYDEARKIFGQVLSDYGTTEYAAPAAEALAFLDENDGKLKEALEGYTGVFAKYAETFTGRRQPLNIARVHEALEQIPEAIEFYKKQSEAFPDSAAAAQSEQALARLKSEHPDLFPAEEAAESGHEGHDHPAEAPAVEATAVEATAAETPAVETPAVETPATEAPATEAPAVETPATEAPAVETPAAEAPAVETTPANP